MIESEKPDAANFVVKITTFLRWQEFALDQLPRNHPNFTEPALYRFAVTQKFPDLQLSINNSACYIRNNTQPTARSGQPIFTCDNTNIRST